VDFRRYEPACCDDPPERLSESEALTGTAAHRLYRARVDRMWLLSGGDRRIPVPMPEP
jgi:hypothetical protein